MAETFRLEWVRCGKARCKSCPHGPYWYAYWREGQRVRKRYVGKDNPRGTAAGGASGAEKRAAGNSPSPPDWRADLYDRSKASVALALRILGCEVGATRETARAAWRRLMWQHHPDRGGDPSEAGYVNAAWCYLAARLGW